MRLTLPPPRSGRSHLAAYLLVAAGLTALFIVSAVVRRLNFDESLALHAGWLIVDGFDAAPAFYMPLTLGLGALGHAVDDPGAVFTLARLAVSIPIVLAIVWAAWEHDPRWEIVGLTVAISLSHYTFTTHALEFRYDAAIQLGVVLAYGAMMRVKPATQAALGVIIAWLFFHHLKGVYYAGVVFAVAHVNLWAVGGQARQHLKALYAGLLSGAGLWLGLSFALGHEAELWRMYTTFFDLATTSERGERLRTLRDGLASDDIWYGFAGVGVAVQVALALSRRDREENRKVVLALALVAATVLFMLLHPRPWPYLLALPAPLVAIVMAQTAADLLGRIPLRFAVYAALIGGTIHVGLGYDIHAMSYVKALDHDKDRQVEALRALKGIVRPEDTILDPSGMAYFMRPVHKEWYIDRLFMDAAVEGQWMRGIEDLVPAECRWVLYTYRLKLLPPRVRDRIEPSYRSLGGGIGIREGDPEADTLVLTPALPHGVLRSHW